MTDTTATTTDATATPTEPATEPEKPAQAETDWKTEARKWEDRAKANKDAADKLAAIEEANKTDQQKAADALAAAQREATEAKTEALRFKIAAEHGITENADLILTGADEETMTKQAKLWADRPPAATTSGAHVASEGRTSDKTSIGGPAQDFATFIQSQRGS